MSLTQPQSRGGVSLLLRIGNPAKRERRRRASSVGLPASRETWSDFELGIKHTTKVSCEMSSLILIFSRFHYVLLIARRRRNNIQEVVTR
ncbi:hypothetical protein PUN28_003191 [Cardiocondyla obscurior]|uniref:Uncharacterized protein n=1 Tax=Cardiocondyla obscurior TaxID=286306 RepID=A0AAW2GKL6_9HYME